MRPVIYSSLKIVEKFYQVKILTKDQLKKLAGCSDMTLWRLLNRYGYLSSYNHNAGYYTLSDIPRFNNHGLWRYKGVCFSRYGTLPDTVSEIIKNSNSGMNSSELENLLQTRNLKPLLHKLSTSAGAITRRKVADTYIYCDPKPERMSEQISTRIKRNREKLTACSMPSPEKIIALLVELIKYPSRNIRPLVSGLSRKGVTINKEEIMKIFSHYNIKKKV